MFTLILNKAIAFLAVVVFVCLIPDKEEYKEMKQISEGSDDTLKN